jgi:glutamate N-acetyltransferase/amino-acid N-acetyltransferase
MGINLSNFLSSKSKIVKMIDFQDLDHIEGLSISVVSANLYNDNRDDLSIFYFRNGANYASVYTQSKIVSENIKWNLNQNSKIKYSLLVNTRNANAFTGEEGYDSLKKLSKIVSSELTRKQQQDEDVPKKILSKDIMFGCTGTIGEPFPYEKIYQQVPNLINKIKYTQNKFLWMKAALSIMTTDTKPKLAMEECTIANKKIKIYGIAKGSGMIYPNMATTLVYIFTDAKLSNDILNKLLKKNISTTFNAITCDGDTSTTDMATIIATGCVDNIKVKDLNDKKIQNFDKALNKVLLNLAKRVVSDGEGSSKFVTINVKKCKSEIEAKQIALSIANSPLVKTAIAGEDPNWGRIIMAIGKAGPKINLKKLLIKFGNFKIVQDGKLHQSYNETKTSKYMKDENIDLDIEIFTGKKSFTVYTMDFTKKYIDINADYRS